MSKNLYVLLFAILSFSSVGQTDDGYELVSQRLTDLSGEYSMRGSSGCENFHISIVEGSMSTIFFADFGAARTPEEALLLSSRSRERLEITENSDNVIAFKYSEPKGMVGPKQSIKVKIVTNSDKEIESLVIKTKRGVFSQTDKIHCKN